MQGSGGFDDIPTGRRGQYVRTVRAADAQGNRLGHLYADDANPRFAKKTPAQLDSEFGGGVDHAVLDNESPFAERIPARTRVPDGPGLADDRDRSDSRLKSPLPLIAAELFSPQNSQKLD